jgi:hypothetical protein
MIRATGAVRESSFGPKGNPTAANLFNIIACLQQQEVVGLQVGT